MDSIIEINSNGSLADVTIQEILRIEHAAARATAIRDAMRKELLGAMTDHGIRRWETDKISITLVDATERETFDKKAYKKDHPEEYWGYVTMTPVAASLRVKANADI